MVLLASLSSLLIDSLHQTGFQVATDEFCLPGKDCKPIEALTV